MKEDFQVKEIQGDWLHCFQCLRKVAHCVCCSKNSSWRKVPICQKEWREISIGRQNRQINRQREISIDRQTERQPDRQTIPKQTDRIYQKSKNQVWASYKLQPVVLRTGSGCADNWWRDVQQIIKDQSEFFFNHWGSFDCISNAHLLVEASCSLSTCPDLK